MQQNDYKNVVAEASKLIPNAAPFQYSAGSVTHKLEGNIATVFGGSYVGSEAIFTIPFANSTTETPPTQSALAFNYLLTQPILFLTTAGIASNAALNSTADARAGLIGTNAAKQKVLRKFTTTTAPFKDYVPVIRYSEILLNYAEAAAYQDNLELATNLLKAVRNRSNPTYVFADTEIKIRSH